MYNSCKTDTPMGEGDAVKASWIIQSDASALGFDWPDISGVFDKVREELGEIESAWSEQDHEQARRELGDLLFSTVNLARFLDADPNEELHRANERFNRRFALLKDEIQHQGLVMRHCTLEELDKVWERVKKVVDHD